MARYHQCLSQVGEIHPKRSSYDNPATERVIRRATGLGTSSQDGYASAPLRTSELGKCSRARADQTTYAPTSITKILSHHSARSSWHGSSREFRAGSSTRGSRRPRASKSVLSDGALDRVANGV